MTELSFDDEIEDPEDETYVPSEWEMTINRSVFNSSVKFYYSRQ